MKTLMKTLKLIMWIMLGLFFLGVGVLFLLNQRFISGVCFVFVGFWILMSIKIIGPAEMAVFIWLGEPVGFRDSGPCFVPWLLGEVKRYPKKMYNFDYRTRKVITQAGKFKSKKEKEETYYGSQVLEVDSVVYLNFPREERGEATGDTLIDVEMMEVKGKKVEKTHPLIKILRAQVPIEDETLKDWTEEAVLGALRVAFGKMTWRQAVEDIKKVTEEAEKVFTSADGALIRAGFSRKGIRLVIAEINLPEELRRALTEVDKQRLEKEAAFFEAKQRAIETIGAIIQMMAEARGVSPETIQAQIEADPALQKEFLDQAKYLIAREQAIKGNSFVNIEVQGAEGLERTFLNLLAAWQRMPMGRGAEIKPEKREEKAAEEAGEKKLKEPVKEEVKEQVRMETKKKQVRLKERRRKETIYGTLVYLIGCSLVGLLIYFFR